MGENGGVLLYCFAENNGLSQIDGFGLSVSSSQLNGVKYWDQYWEGFISDQRSLTEASVRQNHPKTPESNIQHLIEQELAANHSYQDVKFMLDNIASIEALDGTQVQNPEGGRGTRIMYHSAFGKCTTLEA